MPFTATQQSISAALKLIAKAFTRLAQARLLFAAVFVFSMVYLIPGTSASPALPASCDSFALTIGSLQAKVILFAELHSHSALTVACGLELLNAFWPQANMRLLIEGYAPGDQIYQVACKKPGVLCESWESPEVVRRSAENIINYFCHSITAQVYRYFSDKKLIDNDERVDSLLKKSLLPSQKKTALIKAIEKKINFLHFTADKDHMIKQALQRLVQSKKNLGTVVSYQKVFQALFKELKTIFGAHFSGSSYADLTINAVDIFGPDSAFNRQYRDPALLKAIKQQIDKPDGVSMVIAGRNHLRTDGFVISSLQKGRYAGQFALLTYTGDGKHDSFQREL